MKKSLLCLALGLTGFLSASAVNYLSRDEWTITPCSSISEGNGSGPADCMIDDDVNTYWHSNWSNDTATDAHHWFTIDLGSEEQINGFDYRRRQGNSNGQFIAGKIYVSNEPFTTFADHDASKAYLEDTANTPAGEFTFDYTSDADGIKRCSFSTPVTGRYVLVILSDAGANNMGRHACGGDFKLYNLNSQPTALNTADWSVIPCSQSANEGTNGPASLMFDDDPSTFWHQAWEHDTDIAGPHWFIVDMKSTLAIDGFNYWRRQGNGNGSFKVGKVYVNEEGFTPFADHNAAKDFYDNEANVPAGTFNFTFTEDADAPRTCNFAETAYGRYMLVIINEASTRDACCGSFKPFYNSNTNPKAEFYAGIAEKMAFARKLELLSAINPGAILTTPECPDDATAHNVDLKAAEANSTIQDYINSFDNKQLTLKCAIRRQNSPYLGAVVSGNGVAFNTLPAITPDAVWSIQIVDNGLRLFNRTTGLYIGTDQSPKAAANAQTFIPATQSHNGQDYVIFYKGKSSTYISVDTDANNLGSWSTAGDEGAPWIIAAADYDYNEPQISTENEKHYYRIVNARWMHQFSTSNMAAKGENQEGSGNGENNGHEAANIPGIYWSVEDAGNGDGSIYLTNLSGYRLQDNGTAQATLTAEGSPLFLVKMTADQFAGMTGYAISNTATISNSSCLDANANNNSFRWSPTAETNGNGNNGSLWHFILADDEEIANATAAYVTGTLSHVASLPQTDSTLAGIFGEAFANEIKAQYFSEDELNTVAGANDAKLHANERIAAINEAVNAKFSELAGNFTISNANEANTNCYVGTGMSGEDEDAFPALVPTASTNDLTTIWTVNRGEHGFIFNSLHGNCAIAKQITDLYGCIPVAAEGYPAILNYDSSQPGISISFADNEAAGENYTEFGTYNFLHLSGNSKICRWITDQTNSFWHLNALEEASFEIAKTDNGHTLTLGEGITLNDHASAEGLSMTITKLPEESEVSRASVEPADGVHTISAADFENGAVSLADLTEGKYEVSAPAGMFLANGKHANLNGSFTVDNNGTALAIDEIEAANAGSTVIYDLQGRRVNRAAHGIYIVNGRKVIL